MVALLAALLRLVVQVAVLPAVLPARGVRLLPLLTVLPVVLLTGLLPLLRAGLVVRRLAPLLPVLPAVQHRDRLRLGRGNVEVAGDATTIRADAAQIRRAVLNLARNAVQAAAPGPSVKLSVRKDGAHAVIEVWDRGPDIPDAVRARLFEPFFTTREKGTGLGLAFTREIARDHAGDVELSSGGGETSFRVKLPVKGP